MNLLDSLFSYFSIVIREGVFGVSLINICIIIFGILLALILREITARFILNRIKNIVKSFEIDLDNQDWYELYYTSLSSINFFH